MKSNKAILISTLIFFEFAIIGCTSTPPPIAQVGSGSSWEMIKLKPYAGVRARLSGTQNEIEVKAHPVPNMYVISSYPKGVKFPVYPGSTLKEDQPYRKGWHQYFYILPKDDDFVKVYEWYMKVLNFK